MPLLKGSSSVVRGKNIAKLITEGKPPKQAVAIAYSEAGERRKRKNGLADALKAKR